MLPTLNAPTFEVKLISIDTPVRYRPFTVKEEKILLIAEEGNEEKDILYAIRQIVQNCCMTDLDVNRLPLFDLQYLFLQIRAKSVNNVSVVRYRDTEDEEIRDFTIEFDKIKPIVDPNHKTEIQLADNMIVCFKYPTIELLSKQENLELDSLESSMELIANCIDKIIQGDEVFPGDDYKPQEKLDFIENLPTDKFMLILDQFVTSMPKMIHVLEYTNELGHKREIVLEGFRSFFQ